MGTVIVILLNIVLLITEHKQKSLYRVNIHLCQYKLLRD